MAVDPYCLQRQTMAKHDLLRHYLPVWARVLAQAGHDKLMYVDGFSFTGRYTSDEDGGPGGPGSPLIALECFATQEALTAKGLFLFVEEKQQYLNELEQNVLPLPQNRGVSPKRAPSSAVTSSWPRAPRPFPAPAAPPRVAGSSARRPVRPPRSASGGPPASPHMPRWETPRATRQTAGLS